jgi:hypothetical protein
MEAFAKARCMEKKKKILQWKNGMFFALCSLYFVFGLAAMLPAKKLWYKRRSESSKKFFLQYLFVAVMWAVGLA